MRLLLVEDNARLAGFISDGLAAAGFTVDAFGTGADAEAAMQAVQYDAAILDLGLPDIDGMTILTRIRDRRLNVPVLVLTARDGIGDRVAGLNAGADDYLLKPFAMEELVARIRALLRRPGKALGSVLSFGNTALNTTERDFRVDGRPCALSRRELDVMEQLMRRAGRVISKSAIDENIYGFGEEVSPNSVEVIISRLRKNLRAANSTVQILTFRGIGYMLQDAKQ